MLTVRITVEGGVIQDVQCPEGVRVVVKDYDTEGTPEEELHEDDDGYQFIESIWE
jgi:hypothetical protein